MTSGNFFTSVAFIDKVMTAEGKVWRSDRKAIAQSLLAVGSWSASQVLIREPQRTRSKTTCSSHKKAGCRDPRPPVEKLR